MHVEKIVISLGEGKAPLELTLEEALALGLVLDSLLGRRLASREWIPCPIYVPQQPPVLPYQIACGNTSACTKFKN